MKKNVALSGYYGFRNAGDDAVCFAIIEALRQEMKECNITVLSNDVALTEAAYGVHAVNRWQPVKVFKTLLKSDVLISGGGSLIQDVTSKNGYLYYLGIILMAKLTGTKVVIYSQGVGPLIHKRTQQLTAFAFNRAHAIFVRDEASAGLLKSIGVKKKIEVVPDPVLGIQESTFSDVDAKAQLKRQGWRGDCPLALIALREWQDEDHVRDFAAQGDYLVQQGYEVALLAMHHGQDGAISQAVAGHMQERAFVLNEAYPTPTLFGFFSQATLVVGMRLHALIIGAALGKKIMAISYDPKVDAFMAMMKNQAVIPYGSVNADLLIEKTAQCLEADAVESKESLQTLKGRCYLPAKRCRGLLEK